MLKQNLYKIDKLVSTWGSFKPELSSWNPAVPHNMERGQGCSRQALTKFWSLAATFWGGPYWGLSLYCEAQQYSKMENSGFKGPQIKNNF